MIHLNWRGCETKILNPTTREIVGLVLILVALVVVLGGLSPKVGDGVRWAFERLAP